MRVVPFLLFVFPQAFSHQFLGVASNIFPPFVVTQSECFSFAPHTSPFSGNRPPSAMNAAVTILTSPEIRTCML